MGHKHDYWEGIRRWFITKLGVLVQLLHDLFGVDLYVQSETHNNRFVGRVPMPEEEFEEVLHDLGFERNPLASLKSLRSGEVEEGSWRKVGFEESEMQLHLVLYDGEPMRSGDAGYTYLYAHWEYRWDIHPWKHYRGHDLNGPEGVRRMKKMLDEYGVNHEPIRP